MNIRSEFANAAQLFALLCLLFWSFTWNSSSNMEYTRYSAYKHETRMSSKDPNLAKQDKLRLTYQHYYFIKSLAAVQYVSERSSDACLETNSILPTFNEWKEMEKKKQDAVLLNKKATKNQRNASSRKLNFSSSKCGAKILTSNPEAKHKTAILNEKADEYLLNPCRVRTWFVIELCDTVEATQIELANYELYSSSPKKFYVFWSDVYPTMLWHLLGSFEAKDRRTMQTFDLNAKNLGKFIKVVIYSHHGKEHYCPLSVIRVLGYSMVQDFEDKENVNNFREQKVIFNPTSHNENDVVFNKTSFEVSPENKNQFYKDSSFPDFDPSHICSLFIYCNNLSIKNKDLTGKLCVDKPICRFLNTVTSNFDKLCKTNICDKHSYIDKLSNKEGRHKNISLITNVTEKVPSDEGQTEKRSRLPQSNILTNVYKNNSSLKKSKNDFIISSVINKPYDLKSSMKYSNKYMNKVNFSNSTILKNSPTYRNNTTFLREENMKSKCMCNPKDVERQDHSTRVLNGKETEQELAEMEDSVDSAGLIQKESVLIRLKSRIQSSEIELNLINKYLQQLSQSYRHQMESMQVLFNQTVNAINIASEKSELIDNKQQESMNTLENKVHSLNWKIEHLTNGQKDLIKQVVELHGFFLVLEIIIISTIFTIFLNVYQRRNIIFRTRNHHLWKMVA